MARKIGRRRGVWWAAAVALAVVLIILAAAAGERIAYRGRIYPGVAVSGVELSGKTPQRAADLLRRRAAGIPREIRLKTAAGKAVSLSTGRLGIRLDAQKSARQAYVVGREGWIGARLAGMAGALFWKGDLKSAISFRKDVARRAVEGLAAELDAKPRDASVSLDGAKVVVNPSHEGYRLDVAATVSNIRRAAQNLRSEASVAGHTLRPAVLTPAAQDAARRVRAALSAPLVLEAGGRRWTFEPSQTARMIDVSARGSQLEEQVSRRGLEQVAGGMLAFLNVAPQNASYRVSGDAVDILPSHTGRKVQEGKLLAALNGGLFSGRHTFRASTQVAKPSLTTKKAQQLRPTTLIGSYKTDYTWDMEPGQMANYRISSQAINNSLVAPGQVFSFDDKTDNLHYQPSKVIENGKVKEALGGGLCQISTTLYMAATYAGLDVLERHPHYAQLPYIRPGLDATVWFGSGSGPDSGRLDMKFENNTSGYLLLKEWVGNDGYVHAQIWGRPTGKHVQVWSKEVASGPGYTKWITYKKVTKNGRVLFDGVLHTDIYKPLTV